MCVYVCVFLLLQYLLQSCSQRGGGGTYYYCSTYYKSKVQGAWNWAIPCWGQVAVARGKRGLGKVANVDVCVLLLQDLLQSCARGGRRRVEDMCYERRRAEACVDESAHHVCVHHALDWHEKHLQLKTKRFEKKKQSQKGNQHNASTMQVCCGEAEGAASEPAMVQGGGDCVLHFRSAACAAAAGLAGLDAAVLERSRRAGADVELVVPRRMALCVHI